MDIRPAEDADEEGREIMNTSGRALIGAFCACCSRCAAPLAHLDGEAAQD